MSAILHAALLVLALGEAKKMTAVGYLIAAIFFLQFFKPPPFR